MRNCTEKDTSFRRAISIEKRLSTVVAHVHVFGVGPSTVCLIVHETSSNALVKVMMPLYIKIPSENEMKKIVGGIETKRGFPQCLDAPSMAIILQFQNLKRLLQ